MDLEQLLQHSCTKNTPNHKIASEVIELCLDHKERNKVKASYNHSVRLQERRELVQWWADCLDEVKESGANKEAR